MALKTAGGFVSVSDIPEIWRDGGEGVRGDGFGVIFVGFVETFFEGVIHGVDSRFAAGVA